jgi:hypothetical protein
VARVSDLATGGLVSTAGSFATGGTFATVWMGWGVASSEGNTAEFSSYAE